MRPSPPFQVAIDRYGIWRGAVAALMVVVASVVSSWIATLHADALLAAPAARIGVGLLVIGGLVAAASLLAPRPVSLRWDTQRWHLGPAGSAGHEPAAGRLRVAIDLGAWMLLRFDAERVGRRPSARWIPVQRSGLEHCWHALRCAVYSPRRESGAVVDRDNAASASTRPHPAE